MEDAITLLEQWATEAPSEIMSKRLVVDRLLDVRNSCSDFDKPFVDTILVDVPGNTMVPGDWWRDRLTELRLLLADDIGLVA